jgi:hypothetical protein
VYDLSTLVTDGVARIGVSLYPANATLGSNGVTAARFLLIANPEGGWVAGAWTSNNRGADPDCMVLENVTSIDTYTGRLITLTLESGQQLAITPSSACACGSRLRSYNPFGNAVTLAHGPTPKAA